MLLSPFCNAVVFFASEHGSLASIMQILGSLGLVDPPHGRLPTAPSAASIFHRKGHKTINVEEEVAFEIFNHERTLAFKVVKSAWKRCLGSIGTVEQDVADFPPQRLLHESEKVQHDKTGRRGTSTPGTSSRLSARLATTLPDRGTNPSILSTIKPQRPRSTLRAYPRSGEGSGP